MERIDLRIVRAGPRERANVLELLAEHMPEADAARRHEWLYERNPHGPALTMIAYDVASGDPAGITSVFPRRVLCAGKVVLGSIGGDGFVRPAFRRRGIASALHRACLAEMRGDGIEFMFGPPEPYNLRALVHVGSRIVTRVRRYVRPRIAHRALRSFARLTPRTRARIVPLDGADPRVAEVWDRVAASASAHGEEASGAEQGSRPAELVMPVRDPAQYAWRFGRTPAGVQRGYAVLSGGEPIALCALERHGDQVALVDFVAPVDRYTQAARATADACEAGAVVVQVNEHGPGARALWRAGFVPRDAKPFQVLALDGQSAGRALFDARGWYYTWGDGDVDQVF